MVFWRPRYRSVRARHYCPFGFGMMTPTIPTSSTSCSSGISIQQERSKASRRGFRISDSAARSMEFWGRKLRLPSADSAKSMELHKKERNSSTTRSATNSRSFTKETDHGWKRKRHTTRCSALRARSQNDQRDCAAQRNYHPGSAGRNGRRIHAHVLEGQGGNEKDR